MKHELIVPKETNLIHGRTAEETFRFCNRKEYTDSEYDFPVVLGKNENGEAIVVDLPSLGNIVMFASTAGPSVYEWVFFAQMLWAKHSKQLDVDVFEHPSDLLRYISVWHEQYDSGNEDEFEIFLEKICTTIEKRKRGEEDIQRRKVFFVYVIALKLKNLNRNTLNGILKEDLEKLWLQFILCGETSAAASYLKDFAYMFDTVIELESAYNGNRLYGIIRTGGRHPKNSFVRRYVYSTDLSSE